MLRLDLFEVRFGEKMDMVERTWPWVVSRQNTEWVTCISTRFTYIEKVDFGCAS